MGIEKEDFEDGERMREAMLRMSDYYRCPNAGRVLTGTPGDDKVLCGCGRNSPGAQARGVQEPGPHNGGSRGSTHHYKRFLPTATVDEFLAQEMADKVERARKEGGP